MIAQPIRIWTRSRLTWELARMYQKSAQLAAFGLPSIERATEKGLIGHTDARAIDVGGLTIDFAKEVFHFWGGGRIK